MNNLRWFVSFCVAVAVVATIHYRYTETEAERESQESIDRTFRQMTRESNERIRNAGDEAHYRFYPEDRQADRIADRIYERIREDGIQ